MKYIRTRDEIRKTDGLFRIEDKRLGTIYINQYKFPYIPHKEADTIEELCDKFVMTHYFKETNYTKCEVLKEDKDLMIKAVRLKKQHNKDKDLKNEFNIYGAIWTPKGLIYVAKMNDKGELTLI